MVSWGDLVHSDAVKFAAPRITAHFDVDEVKAAVARKAAFKDAALNNYCTPFVISVDRPSDDEQKRVHLASGQLQYFRVQATTLTLSLLPAYDRSQAEGRIILLTQAGYYFLFATVILLFS